MKLADFFVGSRQLFGFLAPGVLWLVTLYLPFSSRFAGEVLAEADALDVLVFLAVALVVGTAVETISFKVAVRISAALRGERVSRERGDSDYFPLSVSPDLRRLCREIALRQAPAPEYVDGMTDRELSQHCKYTVLERSHRFRDRLVEYEAEINLLAMLSLPLVLFAGSTALWGLGGHGTTGRPLLEHLVVPAVALGLATLLLLRLHPLRREEAEWWFRFYLMTAENATEELED